MICLYTTQLFLQQTLTSTVEKGLVTMFVFNSVTVTGTAEDDQDYGSCADSMTFGSGNNVAVVNYKVSRFEADCIEIKGSKGTLAVVRSEVRSVHRNGLKN